ncbi:MAG: IS630 transposase-related protein [Planctomycetota bacterium]
MPKAKSQDLRDRVIALRRSGRPTQEVAELMGVSKAWVRRVMQTLRETGRTEALPRGGWRYQKIDPDRLRALWEARPDATAAELHAELGIDCSVSAVDEALRRMGLTFKKRRSMRPSKTAPMSPSGVIAGEPSNPTPTPVGPSSSTRPGRRPT